MGRCKGYHVREHHRTRNGNRFKAGQEVDALPDVDIVIQSGKTKNRLLLTEADQLRLLGVAKNQGHKYYNLIRDRNPRSMYHLRQLAAKHMGTHPSQSFAAIHKLKKTGAISLHSKIVNGRHVMVPAVNPLFVYVEPTRYSKGDSRPVAGRIIIRVPNRRTKREAKDER